MSVEIKSRASAQARNRSVRSRETIKSTAPARIFVVKPRGVLHVTLRPGQRALIEGADGEGVEVVADERGRLVVSDAGCGKRRVS